MSVSGGPVGPDDDHPNNAADTDGDDTITVNGPAESGSIEEGGDVDYFRFSASAGYEYTIETGGSIDTYLYLYDRDGTTEIDHDDDGGPGTLSLIEWTCTASGTYYVKVRHYSSSETGDYTVSIITPQLY